MELQDEISSVEGEFVSLHQIIRAGCILLQFFNKKILSSIHIQNAIDILFSGNKKRYAITNGTRITIKSTCASNNSIELNKLKNTYKFNHISKIIKNIINIYSIKKINTYAIWYLIGIYKNIENYQIEDLKFNHKYDIKFILNSIITIANNNKKIIIEKEYLICSKEILSPDKKLELEWTIDKNKESILTEIKSVNSRVKISNDFINEFITIF